MAIQRYGQESDAPKPESKPARGLLRRRSKKETPESSGPKRPWRENIEALTMAVIVALLLKAFLLEVSKIPSGSMQPTLMGNPASGVFDRVLVDKLSYALRDPERFEIVVFRHPLERSRNMVKRITGMPGEQFRVEHGDLWTRADDSAAWTILRRPESVMRSAWKELPALSSSGTDWSSAGGTTGWRIDADAIQARGAGRCVFREDQRTLTNAYLDGYPSAVREIATEARRRDPRNFSFPDGDTPVGDLRVDARVRAEADLDELVFEIEEAGARYRFVLPGPAAPSGSSARIEAKLEDGTERSSASEPAWTATAGKATRVRVENLDDRLTLFVAGEPVCELDVEPVPTPRSQLTIEVSGGSVQLGGVRVHRDVHYMPSRTGPSAFEIPEGHYLVLGDNTLDSADSREWQFVDVDLSGEPELPDALRGNYRIHGENPSEPFQAGGRSSVVFRDMWGERWVLPADAPGLHDPTNYQVVPRELVKGRAFAVFWPLRPIQGVWRFGWLH